jgi:two-component system response regulator BaeR
MQIPKILIIEDEENLAKIMQDYLSKENFHSIIVTDGAYAVEKVTEYQPDVILLDLMLPNKDGSNICKEVRQFSNTPIIMTTARIDEIDRIIGLEIGADDYVCKPYSPRELVARVKVQLRKKVINAEIVKDQLVLNSDRLTVSFKDISVELTFVEFKLLERLFKSNGRIFNRDQLMDSIYSDGRIVSDRTIDSHIKKIRKKLKKLDSNKEYIHSIYGCGYKFEDKKVNIEL